MEAPRVEFKVLGPLEVAAGDRVLPLGGPKQRTLLATLLVHTNTAVSGDRLCDAIWGAAPPVSAQANVRSYVAALRKVINPAAGEDRLSQGHGGYQLRVLPGEVDLHLYEDLAARGRAALAGGRHRAAAGHLREALDLWRGGAFDGVAHHDALHIEVARLEESRLAALEDHAEACLALGESRDVIGLLQAEVARYPLRESLWAKLMTAQYHCRRPGDALRSYALARAALRDELGLEPGAELRRLHHAVLTGEPLPEPEPAPVCAERPADCWQPTSQLPSDTTDFVGRRLVLSRAAAVLDPATSASGEAPSCAVPVVILTGLPGVGKTALATRLAHDLRDAFPDGRLFVHLDGARGPQRAPGAVLADLLVSLGVAGSSIPEATVDRAAMFRSLLSGRRVLVLLDDARDEAQIRPLLPGTPGSAALVTSRTRMAGLTGAQLIDVAPFNDEESQDLLRRIVGSPRLAAEPEATERVLASCAGLPLALRVTAARLASRPHWQIRRLADRLADERGRLAELTVGDLAVRTSVAASYHGLTSEAARAFRAIGMLPSPEFPGWALAALLDSRDTDQATDVLIDANLVQVASVDRQGLLRYRTHDLLHVYAGERALAEEPLGWRRAAVARLLDGWLSRVRTAADRLIRRGAEEPVRGEAEDLVGWLERERTSLVTAVEFAAGAGYGTQAAELASAMEDVCHLRNWWDEWERVARAALDRARADGDPVATAVAQGSLARAFAVRGRVDDAVIRWAAAIEQLDALGEAHHAARLRTHRSFAIADRGMAELAHDDARAAAAVMSRLGDEHGQVVALRSLGFALVCRQREAEAVDVLESALRTAERLGRPLALADVLQLLAWAEICHGRFDRCVGHLHRALAAFRTVRHRPGEAYALLTLGRMHIALGPDQAPHALGPLGEAASIFTELGERRGEALASYWLGRTHAASGDPDRAEGHLSTALTGFRNLRMPYWAEQARLRISRVAPATPLS
ncbi:AfsR/SARP family transcriptional regulator [Streptomyces netropsis]|uniref:DNA-binding SARP family transcriptional activator n=1 Tax=Streptomyces netropsis TaxID=55404 RepID=A0A7W7PH70_STRNE|nr:AfsR/SARP family transcriptional regulator [Streptomyces netropsis]MBB4890736.1 DNA-binding SARP family transcriptional activator [Streptomyces netropsis]GGR51352.1 SARP family transcriptional regulator [Streptomyces netropsis]